jgi:hypothetical protein
VTPPIWLDAADRRRPTSRSERGREQHPRAHGPTREAPRQGRQDVVIVIADFAEGPGVGVVSEGLSGRPGALCPALAISATTRQILPVESDDEVFSVSVNEPAEASRIEPRWPPALAIFGVLSLVASLHPSLSLLATWFPTSSRLRFLSRWLPSRDLVESVVAAHRENDGISFLRGRGGRPPGEPDPHCRGDRVPIEGGHRARASGGIHRGVGSERARVLVAVLAT